MYKVYQQTRPGGDDWVTRGYELTFKSRDEAAETAYQWARELELADGYMKPVRNGFLVFDANGVGRMRVMFEETETLPTEPGSIIVNATIRGVEGQTAILDPEGDWFTTTCVEDYWYHDPEDITYWEPYDMGRIVPEAGVNETREEN